MSEEPSHKIDPSACLPPEMVTELSELLALAETVEPIVAELAARYHQLGRWDGAWPTDPAEPKALDARVLAASGDDRLRALLTTIAARAEAAIEGGHTPPEELDHHGLSGFELDEQAHPSCCRRSSQRAIAARAAHALVVCA